MTIENIDEKKIVFAIVLLNISTMLYFYQPGFFTIDEIVYYAATESLAKEGDYYIEYSEIFFNSLVFTRGLSILYNNHIIPPYPFGYPATAAFFAPMFGEEAVFYANMFTGTLTAICVYFLGKHLLGKKTGIMASAAYTLCTYSTYYAISALNITPAVFLITYSVYFFTRQEKAGQKNLFLSSAFAASAVATRYETGVLAIPLIVCILLNNKKPVRDAKYFTIVYLAFLTPLILFQNNVLGNPLMPTYFHDISFPTNNTDRITGESVDFTDRAHALGGLENIPKNAISYLLHSDQVKYAPLENMPFFALAFLALAMGEKKPPKIITLSILTYTTFFTMLPKAGGWAYHMHYLGPIIPLITICSFYPYTQISKKSDGKKTALFLLSIIALTSTHPFFFVYKTNLLAVSALLFATASLAFYKKRLNSLAVALFAASLFAGLMVNAFLIEKTKDKRTLTYEISEELNKATPEKSLVLVSYVEEWQTSYGNPQYIVEVRRAPRQEYLLLIKNSLEKNIPVFITKNAHIDLFAYPPFLEKINESIRTQLYRIKSLEELPEAEKDRPVGNCSLTVRLDTDWTTLELIKARAEHANTSIQNPFDAKIDYKTNTAQISIHKTQYDTRVIEIKTNLSIYTTYDEPAVLVEKGDLGTVEISILCRHNQNQTLNLSETVETSGQQIPLTKQNN